VIAAPDDLDLSTPIWTMPVDIDHGGRWLAAMLSVAERRVCDCVG
jgi:hypothetical protein